MCEQQAEAEADGLTRRRQRDPGQGGHLLVHELEGEAAEDPGGDHLGEGITGAVTPVGQVDGEETQREQHLP